MADQLDMFAAAVVASPPRGRSAGSKPRTSGSEASDPGRSAALPALAYTCPLHDAAHVCEDCPEPLDTDASGFVHRGDCRGRIALRTCERCGELRSPGRWNHGRGDVCLECVPLGAKNR